MTAQRRRIAGVLAAWFLVFGLASRHTWIEGVATALAFVAVA